MNIAFLIKNLIVEIENRNNHQTSACPQLTSDETERKTIYGRIRASQDEIDKIVDKIRECSGNGFTEFNDEEVLIACYVWASIWTDHPSVQITSRSFADIIGRNRVGKLPELLERLLSNKSPLQKYVTIQWQSRYRGECCYTFKVEKPVEFNALFLHGTSTNE